MHIDVSETSHGFREEPARFFWSSTTNSQASSSCTGSIPYLDSWKVFSQFVFSIKLTSKEEMQSVLLYKFQALYLVKYSHVITYAWLIGSHIVDGSFKMCELTQLWCSLGISFTHIIG